MRSLVSLGLMVDVLLQVLAAKDYLPPSYYPYGWWALELTAAYLLVRDR